MRTFGLVLTLVALMIFAGTASAQDKWFYFDFQTLDVTPEILTGLSGYEDPGFQDLPATPEVIGNPVIAPGVYGNAWQFDGATKLDLDNFEAFERVFSQETVVVWFNADATSSEIEGNVFMIYEEGGGTNGMCLYITNDELVVATRDGGADFQKIVSTPFTDAGKWHQAAIVYDTGLLSLFLDGAEVGSIATEYPDDGDYLGAISQHTSDASIGGGQGACTGVADDAAYYVGIIDDFLVFMDYAMTELEIQASVEARNKLTRTWGAIKK